MKNLKQPNPFRPDPVSDQHAAIRAPSNRKHLKCNWLAMSLAAVSFSVSAQSPGKVDFEKEVVPILRENCFDCHGPSKQKAGMRLDRRSSALKAFSRRIVAGNSANSMVYHRLIGSEFGPQMPPKGPLHPEEVTLIQGWIDQGAAWPDALANEEDLPPANPKALALIE